TTSIARAAGVTSKECPVSRGRARPAVKQGIAAAQRKKVAKVVFIASERPTATTFARRPPSLEAPVLKAPTVIQMRVSTAYAWRNAWLIGPPGPTSSPASRPWIELASWCTAIFDQGRRHILGSDRPTIIIESLPHA